MPDLTGALSPAEHKAYLDAMKRIKQALVTAQDERDRRRDVVETPTGPELAWIVFEREAVWRAVNDERARLGRGPVALSDLARAENMATGHCDYTSKFALYAADLAYSTP